jgi:RNA polymerase sigma-70 factor (ECF subfamily)
MIKRKPDNRIVDKVDNAYNENLADATTNPAVIYDNIELARLIEISIDKLPADFRSVFVLRSIQQLSTTETADTLGINEATVKTRLHRARNLMQGYLNQYIEQAGMQVFEFAGKRCDRMVKNVLHELHTNKEFFKGPEYLKLPGKFQVL